MERNRVVFVVKRFAQSQNIAVGYAVHRPYITQSVNLSFVYVMNSLPHFIMFMIVSEISMLTIDCFTMYLHLPY